GRGGEHLPGRERLGELSLHHPRPLLHDPDAQVAQVPPAGVRGRHRQRGGPQVRQRPDGDRHLPGGGPQRPHGHRPSPGGRPPDGPTPMTSEIPTTRDLPRVPRIRGNDHTVLTPPPLGAWTPRLSVSVVIPAHRSQRTLDLVLAALAAQSYPAH